MVWACADGDRETIIDSSLKMGFITGRESKGMLEAHVTAGMAVGQPFSRPGAFDFGKQVSDSHGQSPPVVGQDNAVWSVEMRSKRLVTWCKPPLRV